MDVNIDTVSAEIQRDAETTPKRSPAPAPEQLTKSEEPELSFMTRRERLRARLATF